jgi:hypothetical protein
MKAFTATLLLSSIASALAASQLTYGSSANLANAWQTAVSGDTCAATCTKAGLKNAYFASAQLGVVTSICAANVNSTGWASGWQNATINEAGCHIAYMGQPVIADQYACLCLQMNQTQGIFAASDLTQSCNKTCQQQFPDQYNVINRGSPTPVDVVSQTYGCIPSNELGVLNRFGYTNDTAAAQNSARNVTCNVAYGTTSAANLEYSCFCTFSPVSSRMTQLMVSQGTGSSSLTSAAG